MSLRLSALSALGKSRGAQLAVWIRAALSSCHHTLKLKSRNDKPWLPLDMRLWSVRKSSCHPPLSSHSPCVSVLLILSWCLRIKECSALLLSQQRHGAVRWSRAPVTRRRRGQTIHWQIIYATAVRLDCFYVLAQPLWCVWLTTTNTYTVISVKTPRIHENPHTVH